MTDYDDIRAATDRAESDDATEDAAYVTQISNLQEQLAAVQTALTKVQSDFDAYKKTHSTLDPPTALFTEPLVNMDAFSIYNGSGSYSQQGVRLAENVQLAGGVLSIHTRPVTIAKTIGGVTLNPGDYAAGGVMWKQPLTPGCRISMDLLMTASLGTRAVSLLWPQGSWPMDGELDFIEDGGDIPDRQSTAITNHWYDATKVSSSNPKGNAQRVVKFGPHDFTVWSHVEVLWQKDLFVVLVNNVEAARFTDHMPPGPMQFGIQTAVAGGGKAPTWNGVGRTPGRIDCKNIKVYAA